MPWNTFMRAHDERSPMRAGVIVAGGRSMRFGDRDKVTADLAGVSMIRRVADRLVGVVDTLVVNCRADQIEAISTALAGLDARYATDADPDRGPAAGIRTGLDFVRAEQPTVEYAAVVAADMPLVDPRFVSHLFDRAAGHDAAVPRSDDRLQPLQAVYRVDAMADACAAALSRDEHRVTAAVADLDRVVIEEQELREHADAATLTNVNTRAGITAIADRFSDQAE
ncbi:molybdopterin-guanine dinucleotide biosynthesis protein A [Halococcus salifodinae DSM 8989]|uniref:Probable molybdenum cofactor guanylyltransferase n=2 Tax=Halococcaceae TaxID=1963270 RepID=M0ND92_9EURY|nr:molybdopterin-guanine dinucleotide biosynthesis protein A [Halococcus salifodinae DSM 8989]